MIGIGANAFALQAVGDLLDLATAQRIDNPRLAFAFLEKLQQLLGGLVLVEHAVADVGAIEAAEKLLRVLQRQYLQNILAGLLVGGCGQRDPGHRGETLAQRAKLRVLGAEIMPPLRHAVGFIDREQGQREFIESAQEILADHPLGADVEQFQLAAMQLRQGRARLILAQRGVVAGGLHPVGEQRIDLVFHQRDQRRNHHG